MRIAFQDWILAAALCAAPFAGCGSAKSSSATAAEDPAKDGPSEIQIPEVAYAVEPTAIQKGEQVFTTKGCPACHKIGGGKLVGPDLQGVTSRRGIKWIARMITKPEVMIQKDPTARELLKTHFTPMPAQGVSPEDLPALLSYLKSREG